MNDLHTEPEPKPERQRRPNVDLTVAITPGGCGRVSWELPGAPENGWEEITFPFTVHTAPDEAGWYFAQQFSFVGGNTGYCGIRPRPGGNQLAAFSVFGDDTSVVDTDRCRPGADNGSGASCSAWVPFAHNREYLFTVHRDEVDTLTWRGTLTDAVTGKEWVLGAWALRHDGGIKPSQLGFMEYYKAIDTCEALPQASLHFGAPYHAPSGIAGRCHSPTHYGRCKDRSNYGAEAKPDGRVWMRNGWPNYRKHQRDHSCSRGANVVVNVTVAGQTGPPR